MTDFIPPEPDTIEHDAGCDPQIFDLEAYRDYLTPLRLTREDEDDLIRDLWAVAETLVDQSLYPTSYPQQFEIAAHVFHALDSAVELELEKQVNTEASPQTPTYQKEKEEL